MTEYLYDLLSLHHLLNKALGLSYRALHLYKALCASASHSLCNYYHSNTCARYYKCHPNTEVYHITDKKGYYKRGLYKMRYRYRNKLSYSIYVVRIMRHYIAVSISIEISYRKALHLVKHLTAKLIEKILSNYRHNARVGKITYPTYSIYAKHYKHKHRYSLECLFGRDIMIKGTLDIL